MISTREARGQELMIEALAISFTFLAVISQYARNWALHLLRRHIKPQNDSLGGASLGPWPTALLPLHLMIESGAWLLLGLPGLRFCSRPWSHICVTGGSYW